MPAEKPEPAKPEKAAEETVELSVQSVQHFQGPLPPPQALVQYKAALPGCAERIVSMAKEQAAHRRALESRVITMTGLRNWTARSRPNDHESR